MDVAALITDERLHQRLRRAVPGRYAVHRVRAADDLWAALHTRPVVLAVVEASPRTTTDVVRIVRETRARHPSVPVAAYCHTEAGLSGLVLRLARAGIHELVLAGLDDTGPCFAGLVERAANRLARGVTDDVVAHAASAGVSGPALPLLRAFLATAPRSHTVPELARSLRMRRRTLYKRCEVARLPAPGVLLGWCRLLVAAHLLDDRSRTVERVAHDLEFTSANAFRNLLRHHAALSPTDLRARGGYAHLRDRFVARLAGVAATSAPA